MMGDPFQLYCAWAAEGETCSHKEKRKCHTGNSSKTGWERRGRWCPSLNDNDGKIMHLRENASLQLPQPEQQHSPAAVAGSTSSPRNSLSAGHERNIHWDPGHQALKHKRQKTHLYNDRVQLGSSYRMEVISKAPWLPASLWQPHYPRKALCNGRCWLPGTLQTLLWL